MVRPTARQDVTAPTTVRLRRGVFARLGGSGVQLLLTMAALGGLFSIGYPISQGRLPSLPWTFWLVYVPPFALWLAGVTAWARADETGVSWRYWMKQEMRWEQITRVTLTKRVLLGQQSGFNRVRTIAIRWRTTGPDHHSSTSDVNIRPADFCGRHQRRFATALIALAEQHHRHVVIASRGWEQPLPEGAEEKDWD